MSGVVLFGILLFLGSLNSVCSTEEYTQVFLPGGEVIHAELAVTDQERQLGLMFRDAINEDQGMLFIFERESVHSFWMKNMKISIDILWLDKDKRIVHIEKNVPPCQTQDCPSYDPGVLSKYVLEIKAGLAEEYELKLYDKVDFILD
ncbi:MAG: hypothetical protein GF421_13600 [Candidatus Aminicenantes bacterium]|nr:hypothetical protein [Candidatus Aminicenantes bacterium]